MAEPDGLAAKAIVALGVSAGQLRAAFGLPDGGDGGRASREAGEGGPAAARVPLGPGAVATLKGALRQALHLGHNYIGTEHILLGLVDEQDATAATLAGLGVTRAGGAAADHGGVRGPAASRSGSRLRRLGPGSRAGAGRRPA